MDKSIFRSPAWYRAITLIERSPLRPTTPDARAQYRPGKRRVQRWRRKTRSPQTLTSPSGSQRTD